MSHFLDVQPTDQNQSRALILFGRNVASYKFALARSLLDLADRADDLIRLDELAVPFSAHLCEHLRLSPKQATSRSSRFLQQCRRANEGDISVDELHSITMRLGFRQNQMRSF